MKGRGGPKVRVEFRIAEWNFVMDKEDNTSLVVMLE